MSDLPRNPSPRRWAALAAMIAITAAAATTGAAWGPGPWYDGLAKPAWIPPKWVFPLVWTPLYAMIALAGWRLWLRDPAALAMRLWFVQLALNAAWTWFFFGQQRIGAALVDIVALGAAILATIVAAWPRERVAALLLIPYLAWVAFATALNAALWGLNR